MFAPIARLLAQQKQQQQQLPVQDSGLTEEQVATGTAALEQLGLADHAEALQRDECLDVLFAVGLNPTPDVLESKMRQLTLHAQHTFTWGELSHVWKLLLAEAVDEEQILEQAFMFFDRDGNKEVSIAELTTVMGELGGLLTAEEIGTFVRLMDKNSDGVVGYDEFIHALRDSQLRALPQQHSMPGSSACEVTAAVKQGRGNGAAVQAA